MFTGIVTDIGEIVGIEERAEGLRRIAVACRYDPAGIAIGASIACSGVCLTAVAAEWRGNRSVFEVEAAAETLAVTMAGAWHPGTRLNLERALKIGDELGGHIVSGHVDGLAELVSRDDVNGMARLTFRAPGPLARFIATKGSVALDGVSLTVNTVDGADFSVLVIPHTLAVTTFDRLAVGDRIHLEVDQMARYAARLIETR